jgi:transcriptional regulator of aromatic amino acid metabolism
VPPLRERSGDIELLARFFFQKFRNEQGCHVRGFTQQALSALNAYEKMMVSTARKNKTLKTAYWQENRNKDVVLRDSLGL